MVFNDTTNKQGIVQDAYFEVSANSLSYPIEDITRNANTALDNMVTIRLSANPKWDFDSTNATDLPIGSTDILSGQQDYEFDDDFLVIKAIEVSNSSGKWTKLEQIDHMKLEGQALSDFETTDGVPKYFDVVGNSFMLYPTPNYNRRLVQEGESGIKVYFQRYVDYFTTTDTTKEPGFAKQLHKYVSLFCAYIYACAKNLDKQNALRQRLEFYEGNELRGGNDKGAIFNVYANKDITTKRTIKPFKESTR